MTLAGVMQRPAGTELADQYRAAVSAAALYADAPAGRLQATGADALDLLNRLSTNRVDNLPPGRGAPTILTTDRGRILDLLTVVNAGDYILLLTSPGQQQPVSDWLDKYTIMEDLTVADTTAETALFTLCGPNSRNALATAIPALGNSLAELEPYSAVNTAIARQEVMLLHRSLGGLPAYDLLVDVAAGPAVWASLTAAGFVPIRQETWDTLMVSYAVPRYGRELGDAFNPLEAGLIGAVDFAKGCYIGQEVIARLDTYQKVQKYLVQLRFPPEATVAADANLVSDGRSVGQVTSLAANPATGELLGLGYVRTAHAEIGARLELADPDQGYGEIIARPQLFGAGE